MALTVGRIARRRPDGGESDAPRRGWPFWAAITAAATAADLDVVAFAVGISYASQWGHRGFTHSLVFSAALGTALAGAALGRQALVRWQWWARRSVLFFAVALTHPLLDMLTNGGLGVALWWPFDTGRYFMPYRPIEVSPIGVGAFFTGRGLEVLESELVFIFLPCAVALGLHWAACALRRPASR